jgi:hypothetical protein
VSYTEKKITKLEAALRNHIGNRKLFATRVTNNLRRKNNPSFTPKLSEIFGTIRFKTATTKINVNEIAEFVELAPDFYTARAM